MVPVLNSTTCDFKQVTYKSQCFHLKNRDNNITLHHRVVKIKRVNVQYLTHCNPQQILAISIISSRLFFINSEIQIKKMHLQVYKKQPKNSMVRSHHCTLQEPVGRIPQCDKIGGTIRKRASREGGKKSPWSFPEAQTLKTELSGVWSCSKKNKFAFVGLMLPKAHL